VGRPWMHTPLSNIKPKPHATRFSVARPVTLIFSSLV
jgi:hypothetical protein